jgi:dephospho-CoA kinase
MGMGCNEGYFYIDTHREDNGGSDIKVIALCGMPGSGKGEVARIVQSLGVPVFSMGDIVREFFSDYCPGRDPMETGIYADEERNVHGKDVWARRLMEKVDSAVKADHGIVVIDGLRSSYEAGLFRSHWGYDLKVLAVHSSPDIRFKRLSERGRGDDPSERDVFEERDRRELGWGLGEVIALADIMIINDRDIEHLEREISNVLSGMV